MSLFSSDTGMPFSEEEGKDITPIASEIEQEAQRRREKKQTAAKRPKTYAVPANIERREEVRQPEGFDPETMVKIGEDVQEVLEYTPCSFWVKRTVYPIYKKKEETPQSLSTTILQAELEANILPDCIAGSSLLAQIVVDKFEHHLPEYRQQKRFKSCGMTLNTSSINRWVHHLADKLYPLYHWQVQLVLASDYVQVDESTLAISDRKNKTRKGYIWIVRSASSPGVFFYYNKGSRAAEVPLSLLINFKGALQADGYKAYNIFEGKKDILLLGCLAHVRRKFENALQAGYDAASKALYYIGLLYELEANLKEREADAQEVLRERKEKAYPIIQIFEEWMVQTFNDTHPKSSLGAAISYAFTMLPRIARYTSDARFHIDNNLVENAVRPLALGRKNYLFAANDAGAEDNALFYTLIGSCHQAGVDPHQWLVDVLPRIDQYQGQDIAKLLPVNWKPKK